MNRRGFFGRLIGAGATVAAAAVAKKVDAVVPDLPPSVAPAIAPSTIAPPVFTPPTYTYHYTAPAYYGGLSSQFYDTVNSTSVMATTSNWFRLSTSGSTSA